MLHLVTLAAFAAAPGPGVSLRQVSASLDNRPQCTTFTWIANDKGSARGAITLPVAVNGRTLRMQLDTGADATSVYGQTAGRSGWSKAGEETFRATRFVVAGAAIDRPTVYVNTDMEADASVQGTLGLPALAGRIAVLDYPDKRFCLFAEADVPATIAQVPTVRAMLRNARLYVPVSIGSFASDAVVFDTGSSELPLNVDLATWRTLTGRATTDGAPERYEGSAWGKPIVIPGAPSTGPLRIGTVDLGRATVFTNPAQPTGFGEWPVKTDGVLGNAPLWDGIVVMDLTARVRFAVVR